MPTTTYIPLGTVTLASATSEVLFSGIPSSLGGQNFRDLVIVAAGEPTAGGGGIFRLQVNGDTSSSYTAITAEGSGTAVQSGSITTTFMQLSFHRSTVIDGFFNPHIIQFIDYTATNKHKSAIIRSNAPSNGVGIVAGRWANNSAITSVRLFIESGNWDVNSTFSIYGIAG